MYTKTVQYKLLRYIFYSKKRQRKIMSAKSLKFHSNVNF